MSPQHLSGIRDASRTKIDEQHTNVGNLPTTTTSLSRKLSHHTECMCQLRLATTILAVDLVDTLRLEPTAEDAVPLLAAGREAEAVFSLYQDFGCGPEASATWLRER